ncbi:MAG: DsbA family protein [Qipengyuania sp.]|nr:DsbA family protein [Qipengyuania sp.]
MTRIRRPLALALTAPLALALTACGDKDATDPTAAALAPVAPVPAPAGTAWRDTVVETPEGGHLVGNPNAPIKLVEYGSLTCPTCAAFSEEGMEPLLSKYVDSGRVSFELRNFAVHGPVDIVLARLARCGAKEAVVPLSDQVWKNLQSLTGPLQANQAAVEQAMNLPMDQRFAAMARIGGFYDFFASRGISADQGRACLADVPSLEKLAAETDRYAKQDQVTGTPTFTLNGRKLDGVNGWAALEPVLQRAGAR